jgi:hypothetical protein
MNRTEIDDNDLIVFFPGMLCINTHTGFLEKECLAR